jgi:hypothetical protein
MNLREPLRGKGEVGRVSGFSLPPTWVKSGEWTNIRTTTREGDVQVSKKG